MTTTEPRTTQLIAATKLEKSPLNARKTAASMGMEELKASILSHGLMQNLVVTKHGGGYRVIAGGRRLEAIRQLIAEGKLPGDHAVPCQLVSEAHALEMSLAENTVRLAMHPADQFEAFAALIDQGQTAAQVASRFGVEESLVLKRMKLARVAPQLLEEYRNEGLTLECLMAFTITDDHRQQLKVLKSLQDWQRNDPSAIRDALTEKLVEAGSKLARFVGMDAYTAAGGTSRADLFGDEVYLEKPGLLHRLAEKKLAGLRKELEAEGWGWIEVNPERDWSVISKCERLRPQLIDAPSELVEQKTRLDAELEAVRQALGDSESDDLLEQERSLQQQLDEVEQQLAAFVGFDAQQKQLAGCYVSIAQDGSCCFDKGLVKPEHRKQLARLIQAEDGDAEVKPAKPKPALSESLRRDLAVYRQQIAQVEIAKHPEIALDLLTFQFASRLQDRFTALDGADMEFRRHDAHPSGLKLPSAAQALAAIGKALPDGWCKLKSEAERFEAFRSLAQEEKLSILAYGVALTLQPKLAPAEGDEATAYDLALSLTGGSVAGYWRPTKENFLSRISRDQLLALARDTLGEAWSQTRAGGKKASLVEQLDRAFADPAKHGRTPEQAEKLMQWLPAGMGFELAPAAPRKAKKARKAA